ncbi:hypothetical protein EEB19_10970 [Gordonia sp. OPL2]|nr:hypothetical protein EEB19_10970 [Gordonia sp. OPL2]
MLRQSERGVLRNQLAEASVVGGDSPVQLPIAVDSVDETDSSSDGLLPVAAQVRDGGRYLGDVLLYVMDGRMSLLEFAWVTDVRPSAFPRRDSILIEAAK